MCQTGYYMDKEEKCVKVNLNTLPIFDDSVIKRVVLSLSLTLFF